MGVKLRGTGALKAHNVARKRIDKNTAAGAMSANPRMTRNSNQ